MFCGLSATLGAFRLGALPAIFGRSRSQSGGARSIRGSSFSISCRAVRSAPGGKVRSLGAPREPSRAGGLGRGRRGGRSRWRRKNREPVAVVGRAAAGRPGFRGGGLFPRRQRQFRSGRAKKQATKRRTKKDFPSPKRRRFVKTGFSARYKEARRSGRPRGRKSPPGQRRPSLSAFALRREEVRAARSAFALRREEVRAAWSALGRPPRGPAISGSPWLETAAPFRVKVRQIRGPGYSAPKRNSAAENAAVFILQRRRLFHEYQHEHSTD